jgi:hypothetical protein
LDFFGEEGEGDFEDEKKGKILPFYFYLYFLSVSKGGGKDALREGKILRHLFIFYYFFS